MSMIPDRYARAGRVRRSGHGLVMEIGASSYFLPPDEIPALLRDQVAEIVSSTGEQEGYAWLSPMAYPRKSEMSALIARQLYVVGFRELDRILSGDLGSAAVREFLKES
jgi:hypothetical protein